MLPLGALALTLAFSLHTAAAKDAHRSAHRASAAVTEEQALLVALAQAEAFARGYVATHGVAALRAVDNSMHVVALHTALLHRVTIADTLLATDAHELEMLAGHEHDALHVAVEAERAGRHGEATVAMAQFTRERVSERLRSASATFDLTESRRGARHDIVAEEPMHLISP